MADPMTPERLAERRKEIEAEHVERRYFYGAECSCGECLPCVVRADELAWLDEVERLRTELRDRRTDDLDIRGILKPAPGVGDPAVPMPLGPALAPAIEWLVNDRDRLRLQLESAEQERDAARGVAKGRTELADQMRTERDEAREQVKDTERAVHGFFADADQRGVHLDGMTVDELCDAVMAAIRKGPGR